MRIGGWISVDNKNVDRIREEMINGEIFDMSPAPRFEHSVICGNIYMQLRNALKSSLCLVFMENIDYKYDKESDDYLEPDIMICCDRNEIKGNAYHGTPKFIAEIISPSTTNRDRGIKKDIYEKSGVAEYWIVSPIERALEIYYLENGRYVLHNAYVVEEDENNADYNIKTEITLKCFPVTMTLEDIFTI